MSKAALVARHARPFALAPLLWVAGACSVSMMAFTALIGPIARLLGLAPWAVGAALTAGGIAWMAAAPRWGGLSDVRGRRAALLGALAGFAGVYGALCLCLGAALMWSPPLLLVFAGLLIGRIAGGFFYAGVPAVSAAIVADHFAPAARTRALARLAAANGIGIVIGPALAATLAPYGLGLPLLVTAAAPCAALIVLWRALPRKPLPQTSARAALPFADPRLRAPLALGVLTMFCVSGAQVVVGFYALDRLALAPASAAFVAGIALAVVGLALIGAQLAVRVLDWTPTRLISAGALTSSMGFVLAANAATPAALWLAHFPTAAGIGLMLPAAQALGANAVGAHEQGATAGAVSSAHGLGLTLGPILATLAYQIDARAPYALMALALAGAAIALRGAKDARHAA